MKKTIALVLAVVLILSALPLTVFARTEEGTYNGYYYCTNLSATVAIAHASMTYQGAEKIRFSGTVYYANSDGLSDSEPMICVLTASSVSKSTVAQPGYSITSANESFYVSSTRVESYSVTP